MKTLMVSLCDDANCARCRAAIALSKTPHRPLEPEGDANVRRLMQIGHSRDEAIATATDPRFRGFSADLAARLDRDAGL